MNINDIEKRAVGGFQPRPQMPKPQLKRGVATLASEIASQIGADNGGKGYLESSEKARRLLSAKQNQIKRETFKRGQALGSLELDGSSKADLGLVVLQRATVLEAMHGWLVRGRRRAFMMADATVQGAINIQRVFRGKKARDFARVLRKQVKSVVLIQAIVRRWLARRRRRALMAAAIVPAGAN